MYITGLKKGFEKRLGSFLMIAKSIKRKIMLLNPLTRFKIAEFMAIDPNALRINVGCGKAKFPGWVNIDIEAGADIVIDVRKGLPFDDNSAKFIYCEHVIEHFTYEEGRRLLSEFWRCLNTRGIVRIAMPDLDYIISKYNTDWNNQDWLSWPEYEFVRTKGQMINMTFRSWDHKNLYNEEDLKIQLAEAGFQKINRMEWNKSSIEELCNLETRRDSILIMEAEKI